MAKKPKDTSPPRESNVPELILSVLVSAPHEMHARQMVERSEGRLKLGTVYGALQLMEEKGLVESRQEENPTDYAGTPRRLYKPTGLGVKALQAREMLRAFMAGGVSRLAM